jgi:hypothetical protein
MLRILPLLLLAAPVVAADPAPEPKRVPDTAAFPKAFAAALGDHFEYLGGEPARIHASMGTAAAERFWVAKVRAKTPGRYVFTYSVRHHYPARVTANWRTSDKAEYTFRIAVGEPGAVRVFHPGGYGGSAFPHANAGDTLLVPVHADPFHVDHHFEPIRKVANDDPVFSVIGERTDERYLKDAANPPVVKNAAADRAKLLASWVTSFGNRPGTSTQHSLGAYLELTAPGTFNLTGRLAGGEANDPGVPFRVRPKDGSATVLLESVGFVEHTGKSRYHTTNAIRPGTLEARVGDRVAVGCGGYATGGLTPADPTKTGVVESLPFRDVPAYEPR